MPHDIPLVGMIRVVLGILGSTHADLGDTLFNLLAALGSARTRLVVVVDDIDILTLTAVAAIAAPIIEHVVADVNTFVSLCRLSRTQSWTAAVVMGQQIVVIRSTTASPVATIAVGTFLMPAVAQALTDDTPLDGDVLASID